MKHRKYPKSGGGPDLPVVNGARKPTGSAATKRATPTTDASTAPIKLGPSAFDVWLERGLHKLYDDVANEPIPPELLQLIEDDRRQDEENKPT
jgi:hypothetical protein